jgi:hypothetical protein
MLKKTFSFLSFVILTALITFSSSFGQTPILDENGNKTNLINLNPNQNEEPWIAGGVTAEEWESFTSKLPELQVSSSGPLPSSVDNTTSDAFRPIFNQRGGSCAQASAIGYVFTYEINTLRGLAADNNENRYPYDFTYNFCNSGSGSNGSMPSQGFDIAVDLGIPTAEVYGGFGLGDHDRWVSGYDVYYNGMANRASDNFRIDVSTEEGINTMKEWFDNHGTGDENGGCLVYCYNSSGSDIENLPSASAHAGKKVYTLFGSGGGHAVTIAGYDDDICYDYNGDGQYTNDIDITGDGQVGVEDWENGATLMVNSWGGSWSNSGKIWVMYRLCALDRDDGGMWSNRLYGMNVQEEYVQPEMTFKTTIEHDRRSSIRIRAGVSNNISATSPSETIDWSKAFNYAGGSNPMGGNGNEIIEIGLDVSPLLDEITGTSAKFFLRIDSKGGSGQVENFSLIDYTSGSPVETVCDQTNVTIDAGSSNSPETTYLSIVLSSVPITNKKGSHAINEMHFKNNRVYFTIPKGSEELTPVSIKLFDVRGRCVSTLVNDMFNQGQHSVGIDKVNNSLLAGGFYICRMEAGDMQKNISFSLSK